jgi:hypothetical protein
MQRRSSFPGSRLGTVGKRVGGAFRQRWNVVTA